MELQLCSDLLFSLSQAKRVCNEFRSLPDRRLVRDNAVVVEVSDDGQIKNSFTGLDVILFPN